MRKSSYYRKGKGEKMKQEKERKKRNIWYVIGGIAFVAGMFVVMSKLIEKGSEYLYNRNQRPVNPQNDDDWGPEIVKKSTLEDTKDGEI